MSTALELLTGEMERLFSGPEMKELCTTYLEIDPEEEGIFDGSKSVFARKLVAYCHENKATEALVDVIFALKKGKADNSLRDFYKKSWTTEDLQPESNVSNYVILEKVGKVRLGTTYNCRRIEGDDEILKLNVVDAQYAIDTQAVQRYVMLMRILKANLNPRTEEIVSSGVLEDGRPYAITRPARVGTPLGQKLPLWVPEAMKVFEAVVDALESVHERKIVHGNLGYESVTLVEDEEGKPDVIIGGFGADRLIPIRGSYLGRSPEQARNEPPDMRSDFYALGALLFETIAGKPPFDVGSTAELKLAHMAYPIPSLGDVAEDSNAAGLDGFIASLMNKDPGSRPQDFDALRQKLEEAKREVEKIEIRAANMGTREDIALAIATLYEYPAEDESLNQLYEAAKTYNAWAAAIEVVEEAASGLEDPAHARKLLLWAADSAYKRAKDYVKALGIYEYFMGEDPTDLEVRDSVFEVLEAAGRYEELAQRIGEMAEAEVDPTEKINLLVRIARLQDKKLKDPETAYGYYVACLTGTDSDRELLAPLERLAEQLGKMAEYASSLGEAAAAAEGAGNAALSVDLYGRLGGYYMDKLEEHAYAMTCYQKVLELEPENKEALIAVGDMYRSAQQWAELSQVCMRLGEVEKQPNKRRNYLVETAQLLYEKIGSVDDAMAFLDNVLGEDPAHKTAIDLMTTILKARGESERLAKLLSDTLGLISDKGELVEAQCRLALLYEEQLKDTKNAKVYYDKALELDSSCIDALKGLERLFTASGDTSGLKSNLEAQLATQVTPKQKVDLLSRLADICEEEFKDFGQSIDYLSQILETDDTHRYALIGLSRLYKRAERWEELVDILEKRAAQATDEEKKSLLKERAEIISDKLQDKERAIQALTEVSSLGVDDALMTLAKAQEESGDFKAATDTMKKMVDSIGEADGKQNLLLRIASIEVENLQDLDSAVSTLRRAKDVNPSNKDVLAKLRETMVAKGDHADALMILEQETRLEENPVARAELLAQMGVICIENLDDPNRAMANFKAAIELDENNFAAGYYVVKLYRKKGDTESAVPLYQKLAASVHLLNGEQKAEFFADMGDAYVELERTEEAFSAYSKATAIINAKHGVELMLKFGRLGVEREAYPLVRDRLLNYYNSSQEQLSDEQKVALLIVLSKALLALKEIADANKYLKQVMTLSPENFDAKILLADVQEERGDYRPMVESLMEVAGALDKEDERRIGFLKRVGNVLFEKLKDAEGAVAQIKAALEVAPDDRSLLAELLKIYTATKNFKELVGVILSISEMEDDPKKKSAYYLSAAKVYRRELRDSRKAIEFFEKVLVLDPENQKAAQAIIETLEENEEWESLQTHFKKQITRLAKGSTTEEKVSLYEKLYDLTMNKLRNKNDAILIAEAIEKLQPESMEKKERLAELYGWETEHAKKAISLHNSMLKKNPARVESLRQLYRIYSAQGNPDKTWCTSSLLSLINACTPEELTYYKEYKPTDLLTFASVLEPEQWKRKLLHEDMDQTITSIFSIVQTSIFNACGQDLARYGLDPSHAIDVSQGEYPATQYVNFAAGTLGIAPPPFYFVQGVPGFRGLETNPPCIVSDGNEQAYVDRVATVFSLGQELTLFYPGLFVTQMISSGTEMLSWLLAAIRIFAPTLPVPDNIAGAVSDKLAPVRGSLNDFEMERLQGHVHTFISKSAAEVNLKKWAKAVNYSQDRAGLLLCGDLSTAVKVLREQVTDEIQLADRLRALSLFAVSDAHFELREHLGSALRSA